MTVNAGRSGLGQQVARAVIHRQEHNRRFWNPTCGLQLGTWCLWMLPVHTWKLLFVSTMVLGHLYSLISSIFVVLFSDRLICYIAKAGFKLVVILLPVCLLNSGATGVRPHAQLVLNFLMRKPKRASRSILCKVSTLWYIVWLVQLHLQLVCADGIWNVSLEKMFCGYWKTTLGIVLRVCYSLEQCLL